MVFIFVLAAVVARTPEFSKGRAACTTSMAELGFTGGPSVRVTPNVSVEFKWITDVSWFGSVAVFDNPDGTGTPVAATRHENVGGDPIASTQHAVTISVGAPLAANTGYLFRVRAIDPTGSEPPFSTPTPLPPFFTGVQATKWLLKLRSVK